ncbi:MAG: F510_1955 family glycosylhydrolase [Acidimicrobiales bacterium]
MATRTPSRRPTRRKAARDRRPIYALAAAAVVLVAAVVAAAVALTGGDDDPSPTAASDDPGVAHVHGLGVNPADGSIFVATHYGMFRLAGDAPAERVGDSYQDTMGFTVVGPDHFLGSGHPDVAGTREGLPGLLGLIESTDAGATWEPVSLLGEVDFHGLAYAHDQVYGWDSTSGRFMVSADRKAWDERSTVDLYGFAVDPDDPDHILGGAPDGVVESTDGGRTWGAAGGPALVVLSWDADAGLWGADPAGEVWHRDAGGWTQAGELAGTPQAFLATPDALYAAAGDHNTNRTGIYSSNDGGRTWELRYRDPEG